MVSANSLNLDVLEVIFCYLYGNDLASVALVNKSFLSGVIPRLYRSLYFRVHNAKRYPNVSSSFATLLAHPDLAIHVQHIDIRVPPILNDKIHPDFVRECTRALELCDNLHSFTYTHPSINAMLPMMQGKERLRNIRMHARFTTSQAVGLLNIRKAEKLALDYGSWEVMDILPKWTALIKNSLTSLTLFMSNELNFLVLEAAVKELPQLAELHVIGCPNVDYTKVFRLVSNTPCLESLAMSITETSQPPELPSPSPSLSHLKHLALDVRSGISPAAAASATAPLAVLKALKASFPVLTSVSLKIPEMKTESSRTLIRKLLDAHSSTLRRLVFVDSAIDISIITDICEECDQLEVLSLPIPIKELLTFSEALSYSSTLHTIIDGDAHVTHGPRPYLNQKSVLLVMQRAPTLLRIQSNKRLWTASRDSLRRARVNLERRITGPSGHWFMPPR